MLTTTITPPTITFARNQNVYQVRVTDAGGNAIRSFGSRAFLQGSANAQGIPTGGSIVISYTDPDTSSPVTITFIVQGVVSPENLPQGSGTATSDYILSVFEVIGAHPQLAPFFATTTYQVGADTALLIEARDRTNDYQLNIDTSAINATGWPAVGNQPPVANALPDNFAARFDVFFETSYLRGGWRKVASLKVLPDERGFATLDLESILSREFNYARTRNPDGTLNAIVPDVHTSTAWISDNRRRYIVRAGEQQGTPIAVSDWQQSELLTAIDGGVTHAAWAQGAWINNLTPAQSLATWRPTKERWVSERQPAFLSWYNSLYDGPVSLRVTQAAGDGTAQAPVTLQSTQVALGATVTFAVGAMPLNIAPSTLMYVCEIRLSDETTSVTVATCIYYVDRKYYQSMRFLLWRNSWGVSEELRIVGHYTQQSQVARARAQAPLALQYTAQHRERVQYDAEEQRVGTYRTGYISRDEMIALQDMIRINDVYEVQPDGQLSSLDILTDQFRIYDTRDNLYALEFDATPRLSIHNHAPGFNAENHLNHNNNLPTFGGPWIDNKGVGVGNWTGVGGSWNTGG